VVKEAKEHGSLPVVPIIGDVQETSYIPTPSRQR
jgi:hypothetical protein